MHLTWEAHLLNRKHIRLAAIVGTAMAVSLATTPWASGAPHSSGGDQKDRFQRVTTRTVSTDHIQALSNKPVTVMVQAAGHPITVVEAQVGHSLTASRSNQVRSSLEAEQARIARSVRSLGGTVGNRYQAAYNGMKVTI